MLRYTLDVPVNFTIDLDSELTPANLSIVDNGWVYSYESQNIAKIKNSQLEGWVRPEPSFKPRLFASHRAVTTTAGGTADYPLLTLTVPAGHLENGAVFELDFRFLQSQAATGLANKTLSAWIQINTTKFVNIPITVGTGAQTNRACRFSGHVQCLTAGATAQLVAGAEFSIQGVASEPIVTTGVGTLNSDASPFTITFGINYSNNNAGNTVTTRVGYIAQRN